MIKSELFEEFLVHHCLQVLLVADLAESLQFPVLHASVPRNAVATEYPVADVTLQTPAPDLLIADGTDPSDLIILITDILRISGSTFLGIQDAIELFKSSGENFVLFLKFLLLQQKFAIVLDFMGLSFDFEQQGGNLFLGRLVKSGLFEKRFAITLH